MTEAIEDVEIEDVVEDLNDDEALWEGTAILTFVAQQQDV